MFAKTILDIQKVKLFSLCWSINLFINKLSLFLSSFIIPDVSPYSGHFLSFIQKRDVSAECFAGNRHRVHKCFLHSKHRLLIIFFGLIICFSLTAKYSYADVIEYKYLKRGEGSVPILGNEITIKVMETDEAAAKADSLIYTYKLGLDKRFEKWDDQILKMRAGDEILVTEKDVINTASPAGKTQDDKNYLIKLLEIASSSKKMPYDIEGKTRIKTDSGLEYILITEGKGTKAAPGYTVVFHYTGYLEDNSMFISSC